MHSPRPLHRWLTLQFALLASVPLVTVAALVWLFLVPQMRTDIGIRHQTLARVIAGNISVHLQGAERKLHAVAAYIDKQEPGPAELWFALLDSFTGSGNVFEAIYITDNRGTVYTVGLPRERRGKREDLLGLDVSGRAFIHDARSRNQVVYSETFLSTVSSRLAVALAIPMKNGAIIGEITTDRLSRFVSDLPLESGLLTIILDSQEHIIADSQHALEGQYLRLKAVDNSSNGEGGAAALRKFELEGGTLLGALVNVGQLGWQVLVAQSYQQAFRPITSTMKMIGAGLAISLLLALTAAWLQARGFSRHFNRYAAQARSIAHGDYDQPWPVSRVREFSDLADNLQQMSHAIREREQELSASEERYRTLFETMVQGVIYVDNAGQIISANSAAENILGLDLGRMKGRTLLDLQLKAIRQDGSEFALGEAPIAVALQTGRVVRNVEMGFFNPRTQGYTWVNVSASPQFKKGLCDQVYATMEDITARRQAAEALRHYERIVSTSKDLMTLISRSHTVEAVNDSMLKAIGMPREAVIGRRVAEILKGGLLRAKIEPRINQALSGQTVHTQEWFDLPGPGRRFMDLSYVPMVDRAGSVEGVVINAHDITETHKLQEQLIQSQKIESIGTLAGGVAHEINNPINGIMNYAQLILDRVEEESPARELAREIIRETQRTARIVRNLLTFARRDKQSHSPAQLSDIVSSVLSLIQTIMRHDQIELVVQVAGDLPKIKCRTQQVQQVLMNLMTNARDALNERYPAYSPDKKLLISAQTIEKSGRRYVRATVEDWGTGIPHEHLDRIFDPFFTTKPKENGTGLGLSISYGIVKQHGGELIIETEPGKFTRFHMDLPVDNGWTLGSGVTE